MPEIYIFHIIDNKGYEIPDGATVVRYSWKQDAQTFMHSMVSKNTALVILTDIECDDAHAPCGCYGYDAVCCWHRGSSEDDFANCLCSRRYNITCSYHKHI